MLGVRQFPNSAGDDEIGLPLSEIIPADPLEQTSHRSLKVSDGGQRAKMRQDVFSLAEGEAVIH